ncbi:MAG: PASTA domain-containing protein [Flavobacteriaceae bacterium]|jgi:serine/threonine-protein kinase|nr:PASTA domain-containing protein [Flavobacteriaceae bacterium]
MKILKFIGSWQFWVSAVLAIVLFFGLLQGTFFWLGAYTNHGVQVEVPNLNNLTLDQAVIKLDENGLEYEIDTSKYDPKYKSYQILDIYPLIGSNVKKGRRIFIRANAKTWKPVTVPNIIGKYKYLAFSQLDLVGLKVTDTIYEPSLATNTVLKLLHKGKDIQPGVTLPRFSSLTIVLAKGLAKNVSVPSFIGLDEETAKEMISGNLFSIGSVIYDDPDDKENARIYYQVPAPSNVYDQGQPIDLYLSSKPLEQLKDKIRDLDATFNKIHYEEDSLNNANAGISTFREPASIAPPPARNTPANNTGTLSKREIQKRTTSTKEDPKRPGRIIIE